MVAIRTASQSDVEGCVAVLAALPDYFTPDTYDDLRQRFDECRVWVAEGEDVGIIGCVLLQPRYEHSAEIFYAAVHPDHQRRGVGRRLVERLLSETELPVIEVKTLDASSGYEPYEATRAFWQAMGFVQIDCIDPLPGWQPGNPSAIFIRALERTIGSRSVGTHALIAVCIASHRRLLNALEVLSDEQVVQPSRLPGWSRGHVVTHVAGKSYSHVPLFESALVGEVGVQELGQEHEAAVAKGAGRSAEALRAELRDSFAVLEEAWSALPEDLWDRHAITTAGRRSMHEVVERHLRDVEVHHVDLGIGYEPEDWPEEFLDVELSKRLAGLPARATPPQLLAWLLGRAPAPDLGPG